jgi:hypothetical protein
MIETQAFTEKDNIAADLEQTQKDALVTLINDRWTYSTDEILPLIEQSRKAWDYFLHNTPQANDIALSGGTKDAYTAEQAQRKGLRFPHIPIAVESILAMQHNTTFPSDDRFCRGNPENDFAEKNQELVEQFIAENFGMANTSEQFRKLRLNLMLDGTACLFTRWKQKRNPRRVDYEPKFQVKVPTPLGEVGFSLGGTQKVKGSDIEWEGTEAIPLDFNDWRVDPSARCYEESWFIRRWYQPVYQVEKEFPDAEAKPYTEVVQTSDDNHKREAMGLSPISQVIDPEFEEEGKKNSLLMVCYDDFVLDGEVYENHAAIILNTKEVVWFGPNPYDHGLRPYIVGPYIDIPGQIYGQSAVVHAIPLAESIDKGTDNILRASTWGSNPVFTKRITDPAVRQHKNIRVRPGITLPVSDPTAYQQLNVNIANSEVLFRMITAAEDKLMRVIGNSPFTEGGAPEQGRVSAFEIDQRVQGSNSRSLSIMTTFNNCFIQPFMHINYENFRQFMEKPVMINGKEVNRDMLRLAKYKWLITSTQATISRSRELANKRAFLVELLPQLVQAGAVKLKAEVAEFDLIQYVKEFMTKGGERDVDRHLKVIQGAVPEMMGPVDAGQDSEVAGALPAVPPTPNDARSAIPPEPTA